MRGAADDSHFMFNFTTDDASGNTDGHEIQTDRAADDRDSDTTSDTKNQIDSSTSVTGGSQCNKDMNTTQGNITSLDSSSFHTTLEGTPFLFNFDSG